MLHAVELRLQLKCTYVM